MADQTTREPRTEAGKRLEIWASSQVPIRDLGFDSARDAILAIEEQATAEADLRLLAMTTARDAAVVEAENLREEIAGLQRELQRCEEGPYVPDPGTSEPRSEAGKQAETTLPHFDTCAGMRGPNTCDCGVVSTLRAIEDQAATEARRELLATLRTDVEREFAPCACGPEWRGRHDPYSDCEARAAVLHIIEERA